MNKREQIILEKIKQNINDIDYIFTYDTMTYFLYQKYVIRFERSGYMTIFIYGTNKDNLWNNIFYIETENIFIIQIISNIIFIIFFIVKYMFFIML